MIYQDGERTNVLGVGDSIAECRDNVISYLIKLHIPPPKLDRMMRYFALMNLNDGVTYDAHNKIIKMCIYHCDAKVYIYAKRHGVRGMNVLFETLTEQPYVRFAGYTKETNTEFKLKL